jgi:hypothetical protein
VLGGKAGAAAHPAKGGQACRTRSSSSTVLTSARKTRGAEDDHYDLVEFVETSEPHPIAYNVYLNEAGTRMTVVQIHPDSASMEFHTEMAGPPFTRFVELIELSTMDVYGKPSDAVLEQLRKRFGCWERDGDRARAPCRVHSVRLPLRAIDRRHPPPASIAGLSNYLQGLPNYLA